MEAGAFLFANILPRGEQTDRRAAGPVKIYAQNYLQARLSEVNRQ